MNNSFVFAGTQRKRAIGLTPLIDVVFILLMFFMLASSFKHPGGMELRVPASATTSSLSNSITIRISADELVWIEGVSFSVEELLPRLTGLSQTDASLLVRVQSDDNVKLQQLVDVLDMIGLAGLTKVSVD